MEFAPKVLYGRDPAIWVLFDIRDDEAVRQLHKLRACLQEYSDFEALDAEHMVLIIRPGGVARRSAA